MLNSIDLDRALMIVSSKSGGTIEPMSMFKAFHARQGDGSHFAAVTDPGLEPRGAGGQARLPPGLPRRPGHRRALQRAAARSGSSPPPPRASTSQAILDSAIGAAEECRGEHGNAGLWLGCALGELARQGRDKLTFVADAPLTSYGIWAEQLWAESTGKQGTRHPADRRRAAARARAPTATTASSCTSPLDDAENARKLAALKDAGHPVITIRALGPNDLGRIFFLSEFAVAVAGWVLEINPFDQPNVQEAKDNTNRVLDEGSPGLEEGSLSELTEGLAAAGLLRDHGLPAVLRRDRGRRRAPARRRSSSATTSPPRGATDRASCTRPGSSTRAARRPAASCSSSTSPTEDLEIPGEPYTFATLIRAQADGDLQTLRNHGLPAVRVSVGDIDAIKEQL